MRLLTEFPSALNAVSGDVLTDERLDEAIGGGYDLICANIMADVHIEMKGIYIDKLKVGGKLILSGIIDNRADEVREGL